MAVKIVVSKGSAPKKAASPRALKHPSPCVDESWRARDDLRTLQQAKEIQADKARVKAAEREAEAQVKAIQSVIGGAKK